MPEGKQTNSPPQATYDRIIRAALIEFAEFGLAGARVDRIAERASVNKAMIYYHFSSKENLYRRVVQDHFEKATADVHSRLDPDKSLPELLTAMAQVYANIAADRPKIFQLLMRELANPKSDIINTAAEMISSTGLPGMIMDRIKSGRAAGELRDVRAKHTICSFIAMHIGYFMLAPILHQALDIKDPDKFTADRPEVVVDLFLNGVLPR